MNSNTNEDDEQMKNDVYLKVKIYHLVYGMPFKQLLKLVPNLTLEAFNRIVLEIEYNDKQDNNL